MSVKCASSSRVYFVRLGLILPVHIYKEMWSLRKISVKDNVRASITVVIEGNVEALHSIVQAGL